MAQIDIALRNNVRPLVIRGKDNKLYVDHGDVRKRAAAEVGANVHFLKAQGHVARSKQIILEEFVSSLVWVVLHIH